ncbi:SLC13 family permease [Paraliomyxa miuraensis]|uniref:SLC13 family permease n=1 Tax=Paraliomyxa miuraensis TaxID=376150 RepID=UPI00225A5C2E|nr:SLC13 family permease [Paraliomyxa miuraensis]MCX4241841.1 SLC13 family permease [Paraliomyxa miuraensis]
MDEPSPLPLARAALLGGPLLGAAVGLWVHLGAGLSPAAGWTAAITTVCAVWWVLEPIPLAATSLLPFAAFPFAGVLGAREVAQSYGHHLVLLMLAGSIVSTAMERSGAHRRVAVGLVRLVGGGDGRRLVLGFLLAAAVLSMWMSNTATTVMLLPVALAVIGAARGEALVVPVLLSVTYGASIGGSGTPIGTPPNLVLIDRYREATGTEPSFLGWMRDCLPVVVIMLPLCWRWLVRRVPRSLTVEVGTLGPWRAEERRVLAVFGLTALAWMTRAEPFGGWSTWLGVQDRVGDSTVAIAAALVLFVLPRGTGAGERLLDWETASKVPWGVFILIGGGICLGRAFGASGLDAELGRALGFLTAWPRWLVIPVVCLCATLATEVTSNTAVANILMPILGAAAATDGGDPMWLMLPAVLGVNHSFMLPVASASNAIVYGTGRVSTRQMVREGLGLNLIGAVVISVVCLLTLG